MKLFKYLMLIIGAMGFATMPLAAHGGHGGHGGGHGGHEHDGDSGGHDTDRDEGGQDRSRYLQELNQRDWEALRDYVKAKRDEDEDGDDEDGDDCGLTISGDVRTEWRHMNEKGINQKCNYRLLRGGDAKKNDIPVSRNDFDIEFNLRFDYICDRTWAVAHLDFDNSAGVDGSDKDCKCDPEALKGSGSDNSVCLKKAYMGYNVYECHDARFDVELGRRNLYNVFDSRIQFLSRFDGLTLKYSDKLEYVGDWYWNTAGFVVDERVNHFAWVTEIGFLDIMDSKIDLKYSFIDWKKNGKTRCRTRNARGNNFKISQLTAAYHLDKCIFNMPAKLYGAVLKNHSNVRIRLPLDKCATCVDKKCAACVGNNVKPSIKGEPWGWYVGFVVGEVVHEGDFALSIQYEWVQATAMPDQDASGIGYGNVLNDSFTENGRGNTNYKGVMIEFLYALTDNLSIDTILECSREIKKSIGGRHHYSKIEVEAIYAF